MKELNSHSGWLAKPDQVETLKNLGSAYHRIGEHVKEIECFDRALEIDPIKWEALVSKGVSLIVDFDQPADAADLFDQALKWHCERAVHWPHVWYWLGEARRRAGNDAKRNRGCRQLREIA